MSLKIVTVVGARPQFVKASMVSRAIFSWNREHSDSLVVERLVHTGQHYDDNMSRVFFQEMGLPEPDVNLGVGSGSHGEQTGRMLLGLEEVYRAEAPSVVLVYGDTNSTLAGALAAAKLQLPVAHVEAGLRSFNKRMPEELNRLVADHLSAVLFCPTRISVSNLEREGIRHHGTIASPDAPAVLQVGDVMYDATLHFASRADERDDTRFDAAQSFALATIHRAENTDDSHRLETLLHALAESPVPVVLPLHPRTKKRIDEEPALSEVASNLRILEPLSYLDMLRFEKRCRFVLTDSGGVQKEAYFLKKPCIALRDETEWKETVDVGWNATVGTGPRAIATAIGNASDFDSKTSGAPFDESGAYDDTLYGGGDAAARIVSALVELFSGSRAV